MATKKQKLSIEDLADLIEANPGCTATLDNDWWCLESAMPEDLDEDDDEAYDEWQSTNRICSSDDMLGGGGSYGRDILEALALIVGIEIENV